MPTRFRLREILAERGLGQRELARRSGVSYVTVNAMCVNRTKQVALATLDSIAVALKVAPGDLLTRQARRK